MLAQCCTPYLVNSILPHAVGSSAAGGGGTLTADAMGGRAAKPELEAAQGSNIGSGTSQTISSTTRTGPAQFQGRS